MEWTADHENLLKRMHEEWDEYARSMRELPGCEVFDRAGEIAAMQFCYGQIQNHIHEYRSEEVEWLLVYEKPLEALYAHWVVEQPVDFDTEFEQFFRDGEYEEQESGMNTPNMC